MSVRAVCPSCKVQAMIPEELVGKKLRCQNCAQLFVAGHTGTRSKARIARSRQGGGIVSFLAGVLLIILFVGGAGAGAWWWWTNQQESQPEAGAGSKDSGGRPTAPTLVAQNPNQNPANPNLQGNGLPEQGNNNGSPNRSEAGGNAGQKPPLVMIPDANKKPEPAANEPKKEPEPAVGKPRKPAKSGGKKEEEEEEETPAKKAPAVAEKTDPEKSRGKDPEDMEPKKEPAVKEPKKEPQPVVKESKKEPEPAVKAPKKEPEPAVKAPKKKPEKPRTETEEEPPSFKVASFGGAVLLADGSTLVVSSPGSGELVYIDTVKGKEIKRVEAEFKPGALALRGTTLFAAAQGDPSIHILDAKTGKEHKAINLPGEPYKALGCQPGKGLLFALSESGLVVAINPDTGRAAATVARGQYLAVDPVDGETLYTAFQAPPREKPNGAEGPLNNGRNPFNPMNVPPMPRGGRPNGLGRPPRGVPNAPNFPPMPNFNPMNPQPKPKDKKPKPSEAEKGQFSILLKYKMIKSRGARTLKLVAANERAAIDGWALYLSPDGKKIAMVGDGWQANENAKLRHVIAVYNTKDLKTMAGQVETGDAPAALALHPVLNLGAAAQAADPSEIHLFNAKSLAGKKKLKSGAGEPIYLAFAGRGAKLVVVSTANHREPDGEATLSLLPLPLTDEDRAALKKAYGDE